MRFTKFVLPAWVASGLLAVSAATADDTSLSSRLDPSLYGQLAQNDAPVAAAPVLPAVPQEDAYQLRALPPQEAQEEAETAVPNRYLETQFLKDKGIATYGWIDAGIGANNWGNPWNGPITFNDRNWQAQMNQLYLVNEKVLDLEDGGFDWGGRVDLLYGTDYIFTTARGLDGNLFYQ
ncbi:MAG: outer membrane beta-barrel protein, partial [Planctomycetaceae bacterium]